MVPVVSRRKIISIFIFFFQHCIQKCFVFLFLLVNLMPKFANFSRRQMFITTDFVDGTCFSIFLKTKSHWLYTLNQHHDSESGPDTHGELLVIAQPKVHSAGGSSPSWRCNFFNEQCGGSKTGVSGGSVCSFVIMIN